MNSNLFKIWLPILSLIFIVFYALSSYIEPSVEKSITIATGSKSGNYYKTALEYKRLLEKQNVKVTILNTKGSVENIELVSSGKADIAFVQSGIMRGSRDDVYSLVSLYYEPLWVFYRNEGYSIDYIIQLISKKISIGAIDSGTENLSRMILDINRVDKTNSQIYNYSNVEGKQKLLDGEIDALFVVSSAKSDTVRELLTNPDIKAMSFKRALAYDAKYSYLNQLTLHEGTVDLYMNLPDEDKQLLTTTANLVASPDMNEELIRLLLKQTQKVHAAKGTFEREFQFPNLNNLDSRIHQEAMRYITHGDTWLEKIFPFWIASNIDRLKILIIPFLTLLLPLFKGIIPLYAFTMRSKIYRWYDDLHKLELEVATSTLEKLEELITQIDSLMSEVQNQTKVSLSYKGEYYDLISHIDLVKTMAQSRMRER